MNMSETSAYSSKNKQLTLDLTDEAINVALVVGLAVVGNGELSVRSLSSAVTVGEIVDDNLDELLLAGALLDALSISEELTEERDLGNRIYARIRPAIVHKVALETHRTR